MHHGGALGQQKRLTRDLQVRWTLLQTGVLVSTTSTKDLTTSSSNGCRPLEGLRILITDLDLQQREHRGIAVYTKGLLRALKASGAETWLLTDFEPPMRDPGLRDLPKPARELIFAARVLEALMIGPSGLRSRWAEVKLTRKGGPLGRLMLYWNQLRELPARLRLRRRYAIDQLRRIRLHDLEDSPYLRQERLSYLEDVDGIVCARYLYLNASRLALGRRPTPLRMDLGRQFDGLVTTAPINVCTADGQRLVQTVHDLIPLEYVPHLDHVVLFARRVAGTLPARKLFVSQSSRRKFEQVYPRKGDRGGAVIVQPPSLQMPQGRARTLLNQDVLRPSRRAKARHGELRPFRYLLFNSSVEPRKNLLFVIKAYRLSGLAEAGVRLCVTGQLQKDAYSKAVGEQADESVLLTSYIDESTKANLFLHAMAVLSPSLVEGFGIPVLDGACVGAPVIASPSDSHAEIKKLQDFEQLVWLCPTTNPMDWAVAMRDLANAELLRIQDVDGERQRRLARYDHCEAAVFEQFQRTVCDQILSAEAD